MVSAVGLTGAGRAGDAVRHQPVAGCARTHETAKRVPVVHINKLSTTEIINSFSNTLSINSLRTPTLRNFHIHIRKKIFFFYCTSNEYSLKIITRLRRVNYVPAATKCALCSRATPYAIALSALYDAYLILFLTWE